MRISTFGYVGKQGVKNIWRNKMFSLASIATMSACIFLFGLFFSIIVNFQHIIKTAEEGVAITVFFEEGTTNKQIKAIGKKIKARPEVEKIEYSQLMKPGRNIKSSISRAQRQQTDLRTTILLQTQPTIVCI